VRKVSDLPDPANMLWGFAPKLRGVASPYQNNRFRKGKAFPHIGRL